MSMNLRSFSRFDELDDKAIGLLERLMVEERPSHGHVLVREGDRATGLTASMWLVLEGELMVQAKAPDGGWGIQRRMGPGSLVGLLGLVADVNRSATVVVDGRCRLARLDRATVNEFYRHDVGVHAQFQLLIARHLAEDLRNLTARVSEALRTGEAQALHR